MHPVSGPRARHPRVPNYETDHLKKFSPRPSFPFFKIIVVMGPLPDIQNDVGTWLRDHTVGRRVFKSLMERPSTFQNFLKVLGRLQLATPKLYDLPGTATKLPPSVGTVKAHFTDLAGLLNRGSKGRWPALRQARRDEITMFWLDTLYVYFFAYGTKDSCEDRAVAASNQEREDTWTERHSAMEDMLGNANDNECPCWLDGPELHRLFQEGLTMEVIGLLPLEVDCE